MAAEEVAHRYRILRRLVPEDVPDDENESPVWDEIGTLDPIPYDHSASTHEPRAADLGEAFGEGTYLVLDTEEKYSTKSYYEVEVVAVTTYEDASERV